MRNNNIMVTLELWKNSENEIKGSLCSACAYKIIFKRHNERSTSSACIVTKIIIFMPPSTLSFISHYTTKLLAQTIQVINFHEKQLAANAHRERRIEGKTKVESEHSKHYSRAFSSTFLSYCIFTLLFLLRENFWDFQIFCSVEYLSDCDVEGGRGQRGGGILLFSPFFFFFSIFFLYVKHCIVLSVLLALCEWNESFFFCE